MANDPATDVSGAVGGTAAAGVRNVLSHGWIYTLASAAPMLAGVLILPITTRILNQEQYGLVAIGLVLLQVGNVLLAAGLPISVTRHALVESSGLSGARGVVVLSIAPAVAIGAIAIGTGPLWGGPVLGVPWGSGFVFAITAAAGGSIILSIQAFFRATGRAWTYVALASAPTFFGPVAGILAMLVIDREPEVYLAGLAGATLVGAALGLLIALRGGPVSLRGAALGRALRIGLPTVPHGLALVLVTGGLVLIAGREYGSAASAQVQVAMSIGVVAVVVTASINNAWMPLVLGSRAHERVELINATARALGWVAATGASGIAFIAPWAVRFLAPPEYPPEDLVPVVAAVASAAGFCVAYMASMHLMLVSGRMWPLAISTPLALACGLGSALLMGRVWGPVAVGGGFVVTYAALGVMTTLVSRWAVRENWAPSSLTAPLLFSAIGTTAGGLLPIEGHGALVRVAAAVAVGALAVRRMTSLFRR